MTAPDEAALVRDIELSMAVGFNGAASCTRRFSRNVFSITPTAWVISSGASFPIGGARRADGQSSDFDIPFCAQWLEALERDYAHPSLVGWCGLNETWEVLTDDIKSGGRRHPRNVFVRQGDGHVTPRAGHVRLLPSRARDGHLRQPRLHAGAAQSSCADNAGLSRGKPYVNSSWDGKKSTWSYPYAGQPYFVSEFGGIHWNPKARPLTQTNRTEDEGAIQVSWGYGKSPQTLDEFYNRFAGLCDALLDDPHMFGYCYTQLTDVYQEENGLFYFDRSAKFDAARLHAIQARPAAIETAGGASAPAEMPSTIMLDPSVVSR